MRMFICKTIRTLKKQDKDLATTLNFITKQGHTNLWVTKHQLRSILSIDPKALIINWVLCPQTPGKETSVAVGFQRSRAPKKNPNNRLDRRAETNFLSKRKSNTKLLYANKLQWPSVHQEPRQTENYYPGSKQLSLEKLSSSMGPLQQAQRRRI